VVVSCIQARVVCVGCVWVGESRAGNLKAFPSSAAAARCQRQPHAKMLHEVLMAAVGYTGDIIDDDFCVRATLVPDVISVADRAVIDAIARHGFYYSVLLSAVEPDSSHCRSNGQASFAPAP
jgi:hypothetical protein